MGQSSSPTAALSKIHQVKPKNAMRIVKSSLKKILPSPIVNKIKELKSAIYDTKSYSQYGEDMILRSVLDDRKQGFYVDVGAYHPKWLSNTYYFYTKGWVGINIDATPGSMSLFNELRPRDINIEAAIAREKKELTYFIFSIPWINTFDEKIALERHERGPYKIIDEKKIPTRKLGEILEENIPDGKKIDFLSIDVEGLELEVLHSNNWDKYRPDYILVESFNWNVETIRDSEIYKFLRKEEYTFFARTRYTSIYAGREVMPYLREHGICE